MPYFKIGPVPSSLNNASLTDRFGYVQTRKMNQESVVKIIKYIQNSHDFSAICLSFAHTCPPCFSDHDAITLCQWLKRSSRISDGTGQTDFLGIFSKSAEITYLVKIKARVEHASKLT